MIRIINPCKCLTSISASGKEMYSNAFCKITFNEETRRLSITGVVGPLKNGDCKGSAGQCIDEIRKGTPTKDWTPEMLDKFCNIWDEWHLNDMRPYCEHQRVLGWNELGKKKLTDKNGYTTTASFTYPKDHPDGLLTKECPVCGYKYGTEWKFEEVPEDILKWLFNLPDSKLMPAWI